MSTQSLVEWQELAAEALRSRVSALAGCEVQCVGRCECRDYAMVYVEILEPLIQSREDAAFRKGMEVGRLAGPRRE